LALIISAVRQTRRDFACRKFWPNLKQQPLILKQRLKLGAQTEIVPTVAKRIELFSRDIDVYAALLKWKRAKFSITGKYDVLSAEWTQSLIRKLWERGQKADLRCDMHALYFGDRLAAIDLGLSDGDVFQWAMV